MCMCVCVYMCMCVCVPVIEVGSESGNGVPVWRCDQETNPNVTQLWADVAPRESRARRHESHQIEGQSGLVERTQKREGVCAGDRGK